MRKYAIAGIIGLLLTPGAMWLAYQYRGCYAIGGEALLIPFAMAIVMAYDEVKEMLESLKGGEKQ